MQIMHDSTPAQIKHILPDPAVTGAASLPASNVRQGMFHGHALAQLRTPLRRPDDGVFRRRQLHWGMPQWWTHGKPSFGNGKKMNA